MKSSLSRFAASAFVVFTFVPAFCAQWNATVGAQSEDKSRQVLAFLPNEVWIHAGDAIQWTVKADEIHTITFLTDGQVRPPFTDAVPDLISARRRSMARPA